MRRTDRRLPNPHETDAGEPDKATGQNLGGEPPLFDGQHRPAVEPSRPSLNSARLRHATNQQQRHDGRPGAGRLPPGAHVYLEALHGLARARPMPAQCPLGF